VALALTLGLGPRLAGKLLTEFGTPEVVFNASLTALEAQRLPAAVAQAIHSRQPMSAAAKEPGASSGGWLPPAHLGRDRVSGAAPRDLRSTTPSLRPR
jgi:hypothetical protein